MTTQTSGEINLNNGVEMPALGLEVSEGVRRSGIARGEIFVTTKLWISDYGYEPALRGIEGCLRTLARSA